MRSKDLWNEDYAGWLKKQANLLKKNKYEDMDREHLLEHLLDEMGNMRGELENHIKRLIAHLLKFKYQPEYGYKNGIKNHSWESSCRGAREDIKKHLRINPSLKSYKDTAIKYAYKAAVNKAAKETKLPLNTFPKECEFSWKQLTDDKFYP